MIKKRVNVFKHGDKTNGKAVVFTEETSLQEFLIRASSKLGLSSVPTTVLLDDGTAVADLFDVPNDAIVFVADQASANSLPRCTPAGKPDQVPRETALLADKN